jgi:hypothetical protein
LLYGEVDGDELNLVKLSSPKLVVLPQIRKQTFLTYAYKEEEELSPFICFPFAFEEI